MAKKERTLKLSEIRPCDSCGGAIAPIFRVVQIKMGVFNPEQVNAVLGLNTIFGGALGLAGVMAPGDPVHICEEPDGLIELFLCNTCYCEAVNLAALAEILSDKQARNTEAAAQ